MQLHIIKVLNNNNDNNAIYYYYCYYYNVRYIFDGHRWFIYVHESVLRFYDKFQYQ